MTPTAFSLFSGAGGVSAGLRMAGFEERLAIDLFSTAVKVFKANFPKVPVIHRDIRKVTVEECTEASGLNPGELDLLQASPPCQGYSRAGKRDFADPRNRLYLEVFRIAKALQPKVILIENVKGLAQLQVMRIWCAEIIRGLEELGYRTHVALLDARWLGVPQHRERLMFLGVREDLSVFPSFPAPQASLVGCKRLDERTIYKPHCNKQYIVREGEVAMTLTRHHQFYWDQRTEWGIESYKYASGFPADFNFPCGHRQAVELMGNCVPPTMMMHIARHIRSHILGQMSENLPNNLMA